MKREEAHARSRKARRDAAASVLEGIAQNRAVSALLHPDPKLAAEAFSQQPWLLTQASLLRCGVMEIEAVRLSLEGGDGG